MLRKIMLKTILAVAGFWICLASAEVVQVQPVSAILKQLRMQGYIAFSKIELIDGEYQIQGLANDGKNATIRVNSHSGELISMVKKDSYMTMSDTVDKLEAVGYSNFSLIEAQGNSYFAIALAPNGSKVKLTVNAVTGEVNKGSGLNGTYLTPSQ